VRRVLCCALGSTLAACSGGVELPEAPASEATDAILAEYESPSGTVDDSELNETLERVRLRLDELDIAYLPKLIVELLTALGRRVDSSSLPSDPNEPADSDRPIITAVVELERVCHGWTDPAGPPAAEENGSADITAIFKRSKLDARLWGTATACRERLTLDDAGVTLPSIHLFLDGTLIVHLYGPLPRSSEEAAFWVGFSGALGRESNVRDGVMLDFRVIERRLEFRHPVDDGNIIIGVGLTSVEIRSADASFLCELGTEACQRL
jgi:hypothetical protein